MQKKWEWKANSIETDSRLTFCSQRTFQRKVDGLSREEESYQAVKMDTTFSFLWWFTIVGDIFIKIMAHVLFCMKRNHCLGVHYNPIKKLWLVHIHQNSSWTIDRFSLNSSRAPQARDCIHLDVRSGAYCPLVSLVL